MSRILATSDLHGNLPEIPPCDLLLIGGDICPDWGRVGQLEWLSMEFHNWLVRIQDEGVEQVVGIAGNHDFTLQHLGKEKIESLDLPWTYLQDSLTTAEGLQIYGIPWVPNLPAWAFYAPKDRLHEMYERIPKGTDIVLSHGPPHGYGDKVGTSFMKPHEVSPHVGARQATAMLQRVKPKALICGHIHEGFGYYVYERDGHHVQIYNVAYVDEYYHPRDQIIEIDLGESIMIDAQQEQEEPDNTVG